MTDIVLMKISGGVLAPVDQQGIDYLTKLKLGAGVTVTIKRHNNPKFHRKLMALFNLGFEAWEPGELEYRGEIVAKSFDQFRRDITILAGYFETCINFRGEVRMTARSLNFSAMSAEDREALFNAVINVLLKNVLTNYTRDDLDQVIAQLLRFD
ncbi:MAG: DUF1367 family protein [Telluria sp.]